MRVKVILFQGGVFGLGYQASIKEESVMPEFERPSKSSFQYTMEGCLLFVLFAVVIAAGLTIVILIFNKLFR